MKKIIILIILVVAGYFIYQQTNSFPKIQVPEGWYKHNLNSSVGFLLTKSKELPEIGATELFTYGEQIGFNSFKIKQTPEEWAEQTMLDEDPLFISKTWSSINNYKMLTVKQITQADDMLTQYIFKDNTVYSLYLYPLEKCTIDKCSENEEGLGVLNAIIQDFVYKI